MKKGKNTKDKFVWFDERIGIIQLINTMLSVYICLNDPKTSFCLGMERLSSHCEDQFFGQYRDHFCGFDEIQTAINYAVRVALALDYEHDLNLSFQIPKGENYGGAHLNFKTSKNIN